VTKIAITATVKISDPLVIPSDKGMTAIDACTVAFGMNAIMINNFSLGVVFETLSYTKTPILLNITRPKIMNKPFTR